MGNKICAQFGIRNFGPATEVFEIGEYETPEAAEGQVLVRVHASGINPLDVKGRDGGRWPMRGDRMIPHFDGAGVIEAVGAGVDAGRIGERVWLYEGNWAGPKARRQNTSPSMPRGPILCPKVRVSPREPVLAFRP